MDTCQYLPKIPLLSGPNSALEASRGQSNVNKFQTNPSAFHFLQDAKSSLLRLLKICPSPPAPPCGAFALRPQTTLPPASSSTWGPSAQTWLQTMLTVIPGICFFGLAHIQWYLFLLLFKALSSVSSFVPFSSGKCNATDIWKWSGSLESGNWPLLLELAWERCEQKWEHGLTGPPPPGLRRPSWDLHSVFGRLECTAAGGRDLE